MNYADIKRVDIANGEGVRVSLFVSGCRHHCKGCFNEIAWNFKYGKKFTDETIDEIVKDLDHDYINGLTLLRRRTSGARKSRRIIKTSKNSKRKIPRKKYMVLYRL